jgi:4-hydroxythreonine-4-phosphate dehydrogenase
MGDAAGVGPEVSAKALAEKEVYDFCNPIVIGDADVITKIVDMLKLNLTVNPVKSVDEAKFTYGTIDVFDLDNININELKIGQVQTMCGKAAIEYIEKSVDLLKAGKIHAVSTGSINKEAIRAAGAKVPGHTEMYKNLTNTPKVTMMLASGKLHVFHVTIHVPLSKVPELITKDKVVETIELANNTLQDIGIANPKIAVSGLNPHASDGGLFGDEEEKEIAPAVEEAKKLGINASGPIPPDTVFLRAYRGEFDGAVAMYHDQGHIASKLLEFEGGVNVTIGLPVIRTSVDHGTAFDIAGKGIADPKSMIEALKLAQKMATVKFAK